MPCGDAALTAAVIELWQQGLSAQQISIELSISRREHITRASVVGRVFRERTKNPQLQLRTRAPARATPPRRPRSKSASFQKATPRPPVKRRVLLSPAPAMPYLHLVLPSGAWIKWHRSDGCAYIKNEDVAHPDFCNAPGNPYCAFHSQQMHAPTAHY